MQLERACADLDVPNDAVVTPEWLAREYAPVVYRFCAMVCGNRADADDMAQDALLRAMRHLGRFDPRRGSMEAWLWRIVVNLARDAGRAARRSETYWERLTARREAAAPSAEEQAIDRLQDAEVLAAVRRLPRRYRTLVALRFGADLGYGEIAALTGGSAQAAKQATYRALAALRTQLEVPR